MSEGAQADLLCAFERTSGISQLLSVCRLFEAPADLSSLIRILFRGKLCENADIPVLIEHSPVELAYALALIGANDEYSVTPPWVLKTFPVVGNALKLLRNTPCRKGCAYCRKALDVHKALRDMFDFTEFRTYDGEPLQENAARAAMDGKSLFAVFPTGDGKSGMFQLSALMAGKAAYALTVVISPLRKTKWTTSAKRTLWMR